MENNASKGDVGKNMTYSVLNFDKKEEKHSEEVILTIFLLRVTQMRTLK